MISGICEACGRVEVLHTCSMCGKRVCSVHYANEKGVCTSCLRGLR